MSIAEEIDRLARLHAEGALSDEEFARAKARALGESTPGASPPKIPVPDNTDWGILIHLSQYLAFVIPGAGIIGPIILWQCKKDVSPEVDAHGKVVVNWLITELILTFIFFALCFVLIGIPLLIGLIIVGLVYPVIGAVRASRGEVWRYPMSFNFFR